MNSADYWDARWLALTLLDPPPTWTKGDGSPVNIILSRAKDGDRPSAASYLESPMHAILSALGFANNVEDYLELVKAARRMKNIRRRKP